MVEADTTTVRFLDGTGIPAYSRLLQLQLLIVTAAVYWSLCPKLTTYVDHQRHLTYQHWAGVSPYTLAFAFAGTCVLDKQLQSIRSLRPHCCGKASPKGYA
jgi:hypothetical protein